MNRLGSEHYLLSSALTKIARAVTNRESTTFVIRLSAFHEGVRRNVYLGFNCDKTPQDLPSCTFLLLSSFLLRAQDAISNQRDVLTAPNSSCRLTINGVVAAKDLLGRPGDIRIVNGAVNLSLL